MMKKKLLNLLHNFSDGGIWNEKKKKVLSKLMEIVAKLKLFLPLYFFFFLSFLMNLKFPNINRYRFFFPRYKLRTTVLSR